MLLIFTLLVAYQLKHYFADYPLQGRYMLGKFKPWPECIMPLAAHAGVHALFTSVFVWLLNDRMGLIFGLSLFDFIVHFTMDFVKANPNLLGRFKPLYGEAFIRAVETNDRSKLKSNTLFWWSLGLDQMVHHFTHYVIIYYLVQGKL